MFRLREGCVREISCKCRRVTTPATDNMLPGISSKGWLGEVKQRSHEGCATLPCESITLQSWTDALSKNIYTRMEVEIDEKIMGKIRIPFQCRVGFGFCCSQPSKQLNERTNPNFHKPQSFCSCTTPQYHTRGGSSLGTYAMRSRKKEQANRRRRNRSRLKLGEGNEGRRRIDRHDIKFRRGVVGRNS